MPKPYEIFIALPEKKFFNEKVLVQCEPLITFNLSTVQDYLFRPMSVSKIGPYLAARWLKSTEYFVNVESFDATIEPETLKAIRTHFGNDYSLDVHFMGISLFSEFMHRMSVAMVYRCVQLVEFFLQNKLAKSHIHPAIKFFMNLSLIFMGAASLHLLGYEYSGFVIIETFRYAINMIPGLLKWSNLFQELNLISTKESFSLRDYSLRSSFYLIAISLNAYLKYFKNVIMSEMRGVAPNADRGIEVCVFTRLEDNYKIASIEPIPFSTFDGCLITLSENLGLTVGKIAVDLTIVGLYKLGVVTSLRNPLSRLINKTVSSIPQNESKPKKKFSHTIEDKENVELRASTILPQRNPRVAGQLQGDYTRGVSIPRNLHYKKNAKADVIAENDSPTPTPSTAPDPLSLRQPIDVAGYPKQFLIPMENSYQNIWVVINNKECLHDRNEDNRKKFDNALNKIARTETSSGISLIHHGIYELKIKNSDQRLFGMIASGNDAVYDALKGIYGVERAVSLVDDIQVAGSSKPLAIIVFDRFVKKHEDINTMVTTMQKEARQSAGMHR